MLNSFVSPRVDFVQDLYVLRPASSPALNNSFATSYSFLGCQRPCRFRKRPLRSRFAPGSRASRRPRIGTCSVDATEPVSTPSATIANASHVAPGTTDTDALPSFMEADISKDEAHPWTRPHSISTEELECIM